MGILADVGLGNVNIGGGVDQIFFVLQMVLLLVVAGGVIYYIMFIKQFKHKFRIKEVINGRKVIFDDKAREFKNSEGVTWWQLYKKKIKMSMPPPEAIEIDNKGRKCVEAYRTEAGELIYALDKAKIQDVPKEVLQIKDIGEKEQALKKWREENNVIDAYQPYTTKQRLIMISEHKKALMKKTKKWQEYIMPIAGIAALTIIVVSLMIFYGDMGKPLLEMADKQNNYANIQKEQLLVIQEIKHDIQTLKDEEGQSNKEPPN